MEPLCLDGIKITETHLWPEANVYLKINFKVSHSHY